MLLIIKGMSIIGFVILVTVFVILRWEPKITIGIALALVVATAITLVAGEKILANFLATYAYGFLAAGVVLLLIQHIRESRKG